MVAGVMTVPVPHPPAVSTASASLLSAALAGLLCLTGCSKDEPDSGAGDPHITSSKNVGVMTEAQFTLQCDERGGTVEVMPHCSGFATGRGFSYDSTTEELSEHTCRGANTCGGWNCVVPD
jgi:hypothetical protein